MYLIVIFMGVDFYGRREKGAMLGLPRVVQASAAGEADQLAAVCVLVLEEHLPGIRDHGSDRRVLPRLLHAAGHSHLLVSYCSGAA